MADSRGTTNNEMNAGGCGGSCGGCGLISGSIGLAIVAAVAKTSIPEMPQSIGIPLLIGSIVGLLGGAVFGFLIQTIGVRLIKLISPILLFDQFSQALKESGGMLGLFVWLNGGMIIGSILGGIFGAILGAFFDVQDVYGSGIGAGMLAGAITCGLVGAIAGVTAKLRSNIVNEAVVLEAIFGSLGGLVGGSVFVTVFAALASGNLLPG